MIRWITRFIVGWDRYNFKASDLLLQSAGPFDAACGLVLSIELENVQLKERIDELEKTCSSRLKTIKSLEDEIKDLRSQRKS